MNATKNVGTFLVLTLLLLALVGELMIVPVRAHSKTIYVDVANLSDPNEDGSLGHPFDTIQEGVNASSSGDTIHVASGVYYEYVQITKSSISLVGENQTTIDGGGTRNGVRVGALPPNYAENVSISGFIIQNCVKGVMLVRCRYAHFRNVSMVGNAYNFADHSLQANDIDISNTVDGKPIYYWVKEHGKQVPADAGYVALVNCTNIVVENLNLTKNGQGIVLKYTNSSVIENVNISDNWDGVYVDAWSSNNTIMGCTVTDNLILGIYISTSWSNTVSNNNVSRNEYGVFLTDSSNANTVVNNTVMGNEKGLYLYGESNNLISGNTIRDNTVSNNTVGISLLFSKDNVIYHNNFVNNSKQTSSSNSTDEWDYNNEGNYWSDYMGEDLDSDGVGNNPYLINENNQDKYPLMGLLSCFGVAWQEETYYVLVISNSTILGFGFMQPEKTISLNITGQDVASGFCKVSFPTILLGGPYTILVEGSSVTSSVQTSNGTHTFFYFVYGQGLCNIRIIGTTAIPEFSSFQLSFFFTILLVTTFLHFFGIVVLSKTNRRIERIENIARC